MKKGAVLVSFLSILPFTNSYGQTAKASSVQTSADQQEKTIKGKVTDLKGEPIPGASIFIKGTTRGVIADRDGNFSLKMPVNTKTILVTFIGMKALELAVENKTTLNIRLEESEIGLDEVVAVGYGTAKRRDVVGSISKIGGADITKIPSTSVAESMQGMASGLFVSNNSGHPGAAPSINVRGVHSVNLSSSPLWILDGVPIQTGSLEMTTMGVKPVSPIAMLNPNDIESIEILKDAAATAIYGNRGSNGVIIVTTKSNKGNLTGLSVSYDGGISRLPFKQNDVFVNSVEWWNMYDEAWANTGYTTAFTPNNVIVSNFLDDKPAVMTREQALATNTDHLGEMTQDARFHQFSMMANKGFDTGGVMFSMNYRDEKGLLNNNDLKRLTGRFNFDFTPIKNLSMGVNTNFMYLENSGVMTGMNKGQGGWANWGCMHPWYLVYDATTQTGYSAPSSGYNAVSTSDKNLIRNDVDEYRLIGNAFLKWNTPLKGLSVKGEAGVDLVLNNSSYWRSIFLDPDAPFQNEASEQAVVNHIINYNTYMNYDKAFGKHNFNLTAGAEASESGSYSRGGAGSKINSSYPELINPVLITKAYGYSGGEQNLMGLFGRFNYKFADRYILNASVRRDGHSALNQDNRWATFTAVGLGWIVSDEKFMKNIPQMNLLKLRASYGQTGNTAINRSMTEITWGLANGRYGGDYLPGSTTIGPLGNGGLKWETTSNYDFGVDFALFQNRISGSVAYYTQDVTDLILRGSVAPSTGYDSNQLWENVGDMKNWGWEFNVTSVNINSGGFKWSTDFNFSTNDNEIVRLNAFEKGKGSESAQTIRKEGEKLNTWYLAQYTGVDVQKGIPMMQQRNATKWNTEFVTVPTGTLIPMNSTNAEANKMIMHGKSNLPTFFGGITNKFSYKNVDMNFLLTFVGGNYILNSLYANGSQVNVIFNLIKDMSGKTWERPGDVAKYPQLMYGNIYKYDNAGNPSVSGTRFESKNNTQFLEKGDYIRLRSLQLGYTLPRSISTKANLQNVRFYIGGTNLLTLTKYQGLDPETQNDLPIPRTINFGVSLNL
ncbi:MAG: TonB-dependent receptor [Bacteroidales bacterium]|nr:TonB-dependent receptor [Bacteroidales bacterium]